MSTLYRTQVLLEPEQHQALAAIARQQGRSLSEMLRRIVQAYLDEQSHQARLQRELQAIETLTQIRKQIQESRGVYGQNWLDEVRSERDRDFERIWKGEE
jgi:metal-responsive CopG/Arc/MetJ family transcriptional regulator